MSPEPTSKTDSNESSHQPQIEVLIEKLQVPVDFTRIENITEAATLLQLEQWKENVSSVLKDVLSIVRAKNEEPTSLEDRGNLVFAAAPFAVEFQDAEILSLPIFSPSREFITQVLTHNLKPAFKANPHPRLHATTGRKLARPAGGPMAMQDYYDAQRWKEFPGVGNVILWCVRGVESDAYENMWHLLIPPVMSLLDDYEAKYKLQGVVIVQEMLRHVPKDLLKRTGVDALIRSSLRTSLSHLQSPETPQLLRAAISASISLTLLSTRIAPGSKPTSDRFEELSSLLGEGIISGIWLYAEDKPEAVLATFDSLPPLLEALGLGSVRFMKAMIPQLTHALIPRPMVEPDREIQLSALNALEVILDVCSPRIKTWKATILDAVGRCWVHFVDAERKDENKSHLSGGMRRLCMKLAEVCPSVITEEYKRFLDADHDLFEDLFMMPG
ncbi:hypothetical protein B0H34DRAFT_655026 [Crassisporium funariophilum]|nr:hypothetical protein B0H34DRAFT_655026 [Crassisporium funariophilum]